jgi:transposase-like protein
MTTFAWATNGQAIRLAVSLTCPYCGRALHATDVEQDYETRLICSGCHRDVLIIGSAS